MRKTCSSLSWLALLPASAYAQSIAGVVKDASGGVLPGVTVEASSPVLIEKTRSAVTDGTGQYRIADLLPGTYTVTFTLSGFATLKRDGVEVAGAGVTTISESLRVGNVSETITVTGETPVVDVQTQHEETSDAEHRGAPARCPVSRGYGNLLATVPGIQGTGLDVSSNVVDQLLHLARRPRQRRHDPDRRHERRVGLQRRRRRGLRLSDRAMPPRCRSPWPAALGEVDRGGPQFNMVPKTGGNKLSGTGFASTAGSGRRATTWTTRSGATASPKCRA